MPEQTYDLHIRIPLSKVATIIEVLKDEGSLLNISLVEAKSKRKVPRRYNGAEDNETGADIVDSHVASVAKGQTFRLKVLETIFKKKGRNPHSVSPLLSGLMRAKRIEKIGTGEYKVL